MSCHKDVPIDTIAAEVDALLGEKYILKTDPRVTNAELTSPSIRGDIMMDSAAETALCALVKSCATEPPYGYMWVELPTRPNSVLVSYEEDGQAKVKWEQIASAVIVAGKGASAQRPTAPGLGELYYDTDILSTGKPITWNGEVWVDALGAPV